MAYARSRGLPRARFDVPSSPGQGRFRHDRSYSLGTDEGEDGGDCRFRTRSSFSGSFAHDSFEDLADVAGNGGGQRGGARRWLGAAGGRLRRSVRWAVPVVLLTGLGGGLLEYRRLMRRAAGFDKAWNPITESWSQFYEGEKRASKQVAQDALPSARCAVASAEVNALGNLAVTQKCCSNCPQALFALWHGASIARDLDEQWLGPTGQPRDAPTLAELLALPSKHPFRDPAAATQPQGLQAASHLRAGPSPRRLADVTLVGGHAVGPAAPAQFPPRRPVSSFKGRCTRVTLACFARSRLVADGAGAC
jgi:hypothetical protein